MVAVASHRENKLGYGGNLHTTANREIIVHKTIKEHQATIQD